MVSRVIFKIVETPPLSVGTGTDDDVQNTSVNSEAMTDHISLITYNNPTTVSACHSWTSERHVVYARQPISYLSHVHIVPSRSVELMFTRINVRPLPVLVQ